MTTHEQVDELIAAFALGAVDDAEATLVRRHLPECGECQATLVRMTEVVAVLPLSLEEVAPPAELKDRVLAHVAGRAVAPLAPANHAQEPTTGKLLFLRNWPYVYGLASTPAPDTKIVGKFGIAPLPGLDGPGASNLQATLLDGSHSGVGNVTYITDQHLALVTFHQLAAPEAGKNYELWVIPAGGRAVASGVFLPDPDGSKVMVVNRPIAHGDTIAVTQEAPGGAPQPTSSPIITGQL